MGSRLKGLCVYGTWDWGDNSEGSEERGLATSTTWVLHFDFGGTTCAGHTVNGSRVVSTTMSRLEDFWYGLDMSTIATSLSDHCEDDNDHGMERGMDTLLLGIQR